MFHLLMAMLIHSSEMAEEDFSKKVDAFAAANAAQIAVLNGGDGVLVREWRKHHSPKHLKSILPIRNYGMCQKHIEMYEKIFAANADGNDESDDISLKQFLFPLAKCHFDGNEVDALAEFTVVGDDPTSAIRFDIKVNGNAIAEDVIANGAIFAAKLGSTGYFKSVARTLFTNGIGIGFIAPTYSIPNIVVQQTDKIEFVLKRKTKLKVTADKLSFNVDAELGWTFSVEDACDNVSILGYDLFMCPDCRRNRNSTTINDNYCVV